MAIPLSQVPGREQMASKPGNIIDTYIRIQDINNAVTECKKNITEFNSHTLSNEYLKKNIFPIIDKWLKVTKK